MAKFEVLTGEDAENARKAGAELQVLDDNNLWKDRYGHELRCDDRAIYRIKPVPKKVCRPLGLGDVPPGSVVRRESWKGRAWAMVVSAGHGGIRTVGDNGYITTTWDGMGDIEISRDGGQTWQPCWTEEEAQ